MADATSNKKIIPAIVRAMGFNPTFGVILLYCPPSTGFLCTHAKNQEATGFAVLFLQWFYDM
jgi:hypothetical protein